MTASKTRTPELLELEGALRAAKLTRAQLIDAAILIGTDYNEGIRGVGPVKAVTFIKRHGDLLAALKALGASMPEAQQVRDLFLSHPVDRKFKPKFGKADERKVVAYLEGRGMSGDRGTRLVSAMADAGG